MALRSGDGSIAWQRELPGALIGAPQLHGKVVLLTTADTIVRLDAATGQPLPPIPKGSVPWGAPAIGIGERLVAPTLDGPLLVIDTAKGTVLYSIDAERNTRVLLAGTTLFVVARDHGVQTFPQLR